MSIKTALVRDELGLRPLYYCHNKGVIHAYNSIQDVVAAVQLPLEIDMQGVSAYLLNQYPPYNLTVVDRVKKVPAGCMVVYDENDAGVERYWNIGEDRVKISDAVTDVWDMLNRTIEGMTHNVSEIGVFLSGGLDSSLIAAVAKQYTEEVHTFSMSFNTFSEAKYAEQVAEHLGTKHHHIVLSADRVSKDLRTIVRDFSEPMGDAAGVNNWYLAKYASDYVPVVLSGDGADEIFGGYPWHRLCMMLSIPFSMPWWCKAAIRLALEVLPHGNLTKKANLLHQRASVFCQRLPQAYMESTMSESEVEWLTGNKVSADQDWFHIPTGIKGKLNRLLAFDCANLLPEKFLVRAYGATNNASVEEKCPYVTKEMMDLAFSLPENMKLRGKYGKYVLRLIAEKMLPKNIAWRGKQGFGTPLSDWINGGLRMIVYDRLLNGELSKMLYRKEAVDTITRQVHGGKVWHYHEASAIWSLFALQVWYDVHFARN